MFTVRCYFLLKLCPLSSCPCGGVFDHVLRVMDGVLVVVGVAPSQLDETLKLVPNLAGWFWRHRTRHIHIRVALRNKRLSESEVKWIADRDFPVSLVHVSGLTFEQSLQCGHLQDLGFSVVSGSSHAAWVGSLFWPTHFEDGCVVSLDVVKASFPLALIRKVESTIRHFHHLTFPGGSKRRRVQQVLCSGVV